MGGDYLQVKSDIAYAENADINPALLRRSIQADLVDLVHWHHFVGTVGYAPADITFDYTSMTDCKKVIVKNNGDTNNIVLYMYNSTAWGAILVEPGDKAEFNPYGGTAFKVGTDAGGKTTEAEIFFFGT